MANINVTYQDIKDVADKLVVGKDDIATRLTELQQLVNGLIEAGYNTDQSSVAFGEQYEMFTKGLRDGIEGLDGLSKFLHAAATALQDTDTQLASAIRGE